MHTWCEALGRNSLVNISLSLGEMQSQYATYTNTHTHTSMPMVALTLPTLPRVTLRCPNGPLCAPYGGLHFARTLQPVFKIDANLVTALILCTSAAKSQALTWHTDGTSNAGGWHTDITSTAGAMAPSRQNSTYKPKATSTATSDKMERCTSNNPMKALLSFFLLLSFCGVF